MGSGAVGDRGIGGTISNSSDQMEMRCCPNSPAVSWWVGGGGGSFSGG